ncbi:alpha-glucosidase [Enterococcus montenegrensis]|uniref:glycoside hydrolase family 13 protein n=1 Tax=Enterococcus montenegrensis TaxID=3031993 RepID=UPI00249F7E81|nr:alpha-glucosidase [Enterococcus montenegrensis]WHA09232.1 alpha-glucosidase [Enterococcus montenegrensis]
MASKWWQQSVFYQIYPRSFQDSNNDGIGDIKGITARLSYLEKLGIDAIWLSPVFASPNVDNGYDVSDYCAIMPEFGTMADMEELIATAKKAGIKIIMDLVVNHTSSEHPWFKKALAGDPHYKDYYIFRSDKNGLPNDLNSFFGGCAWEHLPATNEYYFHLFAKEQPDLNWENPAVRKEVWQIMNFWLQKGVGGFRLDVIELIGKIPDQKIIGDGPALHPYLQEMYREVLAGHDVVTIGETGSVTPLTAPLYTDPKRKELSMVFQFQHMALDEVAKTSKWNLKSLNVSVLKTVLSRWQTDLPKEAWNSLFWSNHDQPRILSRWGNVADYPTKSSKMLAILLHLMRGTPFIYQGEELGMTNQYVDKISQLDDIESIHYYEEEKTKGSSEATIWQAINTKGRDNARTPMQWSNVPNAGFTGENVTPWYNLNPNYTTINAQTRLDDPESIFYTYQKLIQLRKNYPLIVWGDYDLLDTAENIFAYTRSYEGETWLICANFSDSKQALSLPYAATETIITNYPHTYHHLNQLNLLPYETFVVKLA